MLAAASLESGDCAVAPAHLPHTGGDGLPGGHVAGRARRGRVRDGAVEHVSEFGPGRYAEFGEDPVQVRADGAVRKVELLTDLAVAQAFGGHLGDLQFLRAELIVRFRR